ncbi:MAG: pyridoxamine 5'-phosphate oxidase family protein [Betaproteobacteria bacterium]|nr:pyridoxamine 5'-phosphate oxidase family protein [Betaproteobacteria bacterium]
MGKFSELVNMLQIGESITDSRSGHSGELRMRERFPSTYQWDETSASGMIRDRISPGLARFIEAQQFFFIATASMQGHCDASFRGREYSTFGKPLPTVWVVDEFHLVFPDYPGNGLYNSLGNIAENPHIGMLFMDFQHQRRARVNGKAAIVPADAEVRETWPMAQAVVVVRVEQAYANCRARIPKLTVAPESDLAE